MARLIGRDKVAASTKDRGMIHGVNLSGWLVLEPWVTPSLFAGTGAFDEIELAASVEPSRYAAMVAKHRADFIGENDFLSIANRGYDAVRLQVPWFVFGEAGPMPGPSAGCLNYVDLAFDWAEAAGVDILLDLALSPGSDAASPASFFADEASLRQAVLDVVGALASRYAGRSNFLGIQPVDEIRGRSRRGFHLVEGVPPHLLRNFYRDVYDVVREAAGDDPVIVLHDACLPDAWRGFMSPSRYTNVWLDSHVYHYSEAMNAAGPTGVRRLVADSKKYLDRARKSGLPVMVGEWSSALPLADAGMTPEGRIALERVYTAGQISAFAGCEGWFFQTWKTEGRLTSWDARVALSSFENGMFD